jgi:hypothetical protein
MYQRIADDLASEKPDEIQSVEADHASLCPNF